MKKLLPVSSCYHQLQLTVKGSPTAAGTLVPVVKPKGAKAPGTWGVTNRLAEANGKLNPL